MRTKPRFAEFRQSTMSFFLFLTVIQAIVAAALVGVILVQRSEGGGLGVGGGSPAGLMSARGAANFLTRATTVLATLFVLLSIALAALAVSTTSEREIDTTLDRSVAPSNDPLAAPATGTPPPAGAAAPQAAPSQNAPVAPADAVGSDPLGKPAQ